MKISPIDYLFDNETDVIMNAELATISLHNLPEAISKAIIIVLMIFNFRKELTKE